MLDQIRQWWRRFSRNPGPHHWNPEVLIRTSDVGQKRDAALVHDSGQNLEVYVYRHGAKIRSDDRIGVLIHVSPPLESIELKWVSDISITITLRCERISDFKPPWKASLSENAVDVVSIG